MTRLRFALLALCAVSLACATQTIPSGSKNAQSRLPVASVTFQPSLDGKIPPEIIGIVAVDLLTVRACPAESCQIVYKDGREWYMGKGEIVMGACYPFEDGSTWFGFDFVDGDATRFVAAVYNGEVYVEGCK